MIYISIVAYNLHDDKSNLLYILLFTLSSGGMSNSLFCCSLPESTIISMGEPTQALLRLYGDQSRDMSIQLEIFELLSLKGLGPKLYGNFEDGRLEEFLPANSLTCEELMDHEISSIIAKKLASVHSLDVPIDKQNTWLLDRFNEWVEFINRDGVPNFNEETRQSTIEIAQELLAINFNKEIEFLSCLFDKTQSPIVFSHNDLHQGNILLAKYSKRRPTLEERIIFIDFEYCSYNYRAYDIANHFCEWCFEYDTPEYPHFIFLEDRFPSKDVQRNFIHHYIDQRGHLAVSHKTLSTLVDNKTNTHNHNRVNHRDSNGSSNGHHVNGHSNGTTTMNKALEDALLDEVKPFFMAANLLWTLWCIKSAQCSTIKFGYWVCILLNILIASFTIYSLVILIFSFLF